MVVNDDSLGILPLKVIVPVTEWQDRYKVAPWMVRLDAGAGTGLTKISAADAFQVRSLSQQRFSRKLGNVPPAQMELITKALAAVLKIKL